MAVVFSDIWQEMSFSVYDKLDLLQGVEEVRVEGTERAGSVEKMEPEGCPAKF